LKEALDIFMWLGLAYMLFIFLRGMNETQVAKHEQKLKDIEEKNRSKEEEQK